MRERGRPDHEVPCRLAFTLIDTDPRLGGAQHGRMKPTDTPFTAIYTEWMKSFLALIPGGSPAAGPAEDLPAKAAQVAAVQEWRTKAAASSPCRPSQAWTRHPRSRSEVKGRGWLYVQYCPIVAPHGGDRGVPGTERTSARGGLLRQGAAPHRRRRRHRKDQHPRAPRGQPGPQGTDPQRIMLLTFTRRAACPKMERRAGALRHKRCPLCACPGAAPSTPSPTGCSAAIGRVGLDECFTVLDQGEPRT